MSYPEFLCSPLFFHPLFWPLPLLLQLYPWTSVLYRWSFLFFLSLTCVITPQRNTDIHIINIVIRISYDSNTQPFLYPLSYFIYSFPGCKNCYLRFGIIKIIGTFGFQ